MKSSCTFFILFFSIFFLFHPAIGQELTMPDKIENLRLTGENAVGNTVRTYDGRYEGSKGHPYFSEEWLLGNVLLENEYTYQQVELKYDIYQDELIGLQHEKFAIILEKDKVRAFTMRLAGEEQVLNFVKARHLAHNIKSVDGDQYVQVLFEGKVSLYAVHRKQLNKANYRGAYNYGNKFDEFVKVKADYYLAESGEAKKLKLKKRKLIQAFKSHQEMLNDFINEQQLELKEESDLLKLVSFYEKINQ